MAVNLKETDKNQQTPPFYAASRGNLGMVSFGMVRFSGVRAQRPDDTNEPAIFYSTSNGHKDVTGMLIKRGAPVDVVSTERLCPRCLLSESQPATLNTTRERKTQRRPDDSCPAAAASVLLSKSAWG